MSFRSVDPRKPFRAMKFMLDTKAPFGVFVSYLRTCLSRKLIIGNAPDLTKFHEDKSLGIFTDDWFSANIPYWHHVFLKAGYYEKDLKTLEIGSWEGMSTLFILSSLPRAMHTSVDTWAGADEHQGSKSLDTIEKNFDHNTKNYQDRLKKFKGTSFSFFNQMQGYDHFDLIYIDGSHHTDDVIIDAIKSFEQLKVGGLMIFDDYFWAYYDKPIDNPAGAVNAFLGLKIGSYEILAVYNQLILKKLSDSRRVSH